MATHTEESLLSLTRTKPFLLAPMAGITDCAFRSFMSELGTPVVFSELLSANGLLFGNGRTLTLAAFEEIQRPYGIQLFGDDPDSLAEAAYRMQEFGADFIDLNMGCPVKKVVSKGAGSALLKDLKQLALTVKTVKSRLRVPLTMKIRTGWTEELKNAPEVAHIAYEEGVLWVAIHGRTRSAGYTGLADWEYMANVAANARLPIIGNGDIVSPELAVGRYQNSPFHAVMIGRGCLKNPWIFQEALSLLKGEELMSQRDFAGLFKKLYGIYQRHSEERVVLIQMKKFASWFSSGLPESASFRKSLFQMKTIEEVMERTISYFLEYNNFKPSDTSHEAFLMGGHG